MCFQRVYPVFTTPPRFASDRLRSVPSSAILLGMQKATIFENGGNIAITEFSWNPTDMYGNSSESICEEYYNVPKCYGQRSAPGVDPKYWIPQ